MKPAENSQTKSERPAAVVAAQFWLVPPSGSEPVQTLMAIGCLLLTHTKVPEVISMKIVHRINI